MALIPDHRAHPSHAVALDRDAMTALSIPPLDQSRILGNLQLLSDDTSGGGEAAVAAAATDGDAVEDQSTPAGDDASSGPAETQKAGHTERRSTISYSMPESLRMLKSRVWELFQHDVVASRTTRLFVEGDLIKYQEGKTASETRRYLLLDSCILWCSVKSKGKTMQHDSLAIKGRLDKGTYSVIDLPDRHKKV
jgi:hypothetical protein